MISHPSINVFIVLSFLSCISILLSATSAGNHLVKIDAASSNMEFAHSDFSSQLSVGCYGFWEGGNCTDLLATMLLSEYFDVDLAYSDVENSPDVIFVSVFGDLHKTESLLARHPRSFRIFYSGENKDHTMFKEGLIDLSLGSRCPTRSQTACVRFPFWMDYIVTSSCHIRSDVFAFANQSGLSWAERPCFASLVSSHGAYPRKELFQELSNISFVEAPGRFIQNTPFVPHNKIEFLKRCRFNVCPENSHGDGYVTEKLFDAVRSGAVPIYWGESFPEPHILNSQRIVNLSPSDNITAVVHKVEELEANSTFRDTFFSLPVFMPQAQEQVAAICADHLNQVAARFPNLRRSRAWGLGAQSKGNPPNLGTA